MPISLLNFVRRMGLIVRSVEVGDREIEGWRVVLVRDGVGGRGFQWVVFQEGVLCN